MENTEQTTPKKGKKVNVVVVIVVTLIIIGGIILGIVLFLNGQKNLTKRLQYVETEDGTYLVTGYDSPLVDASNKLELKIPETYNGKAVTELGEILRGKDGLVSSLFLSKNIRKVSTFGLYSNHLVSISVDTENPYFTSVDGVLFNKDCTKLLCYPGGKEGDEFTIPATVTEIDSQAFAICRIKKLTIPASLTAITVDATGMWESGVFCEEIKSVYYEGSLESWFEIDFSTSDILKTADLYCQNSKIDESTFLTKNSGPIGAKTYKTPSVKVLKANAFWNTGAWAQNINTSNDELIVADSVEVIERDGFGSRYSKVHLSGEWKVSGKETDVSDPIVAARYYNEGSYFVKIK